MHVISTFHYKNYRADIDQLTNNDILHIYDVFDQSDIDLIFKNGMPKYIISDHITKSKINFNNAKFYGLPLYINSISKNIIKNTEFDNNINTLNCFNFMINKKQINRFLCIKFVEWFNLYNFDYTWSAVDQQFDMSKIIYELDLLGKDSPLNKDTKTFILSQIRLPKKFIEFLDTSTNNFGVQNFGGVEWSWQNIMQKLFLSSAISLITETVAYERSSVFTEKTLYSVLGLTFPIWIGGYNQAAEWKRIGFDIFDDIIDHSYQNYHTLIERCYYAFLFNLDLLSNINQAAELRLLHKNRLFKNRDLLVQNHLETFINQEITTFPEELQMGMPEIQKYF